MPGPWGALGRPGEGRGGGRPSPWLGENDAPPLFGDGKGWPSAFWGRERPGAEASSGGQVGGEERKVAKVHKNVIIVKVFWVWGQVVLGYKPQVIHESKAKIAQKLNGALQKCSK